ncbi:TPA: DUF362 domain-containing protein [Candidatus Poribacteria bacterium]|nr:DUF362 domain-containing protein [Candidatus Poribacteria bacterium]
MSCVSVVASKERIKAVTEALNEIRDDIQADRINNKSVFIKPNLVSVSKLLAVTHVDAVRAVIDFIQDFKPTRIVIGEGTGGIFKAYENFGYNLLEREYDDVQLLDVNNDEFGEIQLLTMTGEERAVKFSQTALDADYTISVARAKTHDHTKCTLAIKNMQGCIPRKEQVWAHGDSREYHEGPIPMSYKSNCILSRNIVTIAQKVKLDLGVIDGIEAMEGNGPGGGDPVDLGVVVASADVVAAEAVMAEIMGFDPREVAHIYYADKIGFGIGKLENIEVLGERIEDVRKPVKPHRNYYESQVDWRKYAEGILM